MQLVLFVLAIVGDPVYDDDDVPPYAGTQCSDFAKLYCTDTCAWHNATDVCAPTYVVLCANGTPTAERSLTANTTNCTECNFGYYRIDATNKCEFNCSSANTC